MDVKGGVAYIDCKYADISTGGTLVISDIYNYFGNAYKSKKVVVLRNLVISGEILSDIPVSGIRETSSSDFIVFFRIPGITGVSIVSRYLTIKNDDSVIVTSV